MTVPLSAFSEDAVADIHDRFVLLLVLGVTDLRAMALVAGLWVSVGS